MLRRSLCALAAVAGLSLVPSADAHPTEYHRGYQVYRGHVIHGNVRVYYRRCATEPWCVYGTYCESVQVHSTMRMLRARGYEVMFRGC
jgi:hypothetical protein